MREGRGLTRVAASETGLGQTPLELLGIHLTVLQTGSDIQPWVTGLLVGCESDGTTCRRAWN